MVLDISHTTLAYSALENFRGLELPRTRTFLSDNNAGCIPVRNVSVQRVYLSLIFVQGRELWGPKSDVGLPCR